VLRNSLIVISDNDFNRGSRLRTIGVIHWSLKRTGRQHWFINNFGLLTSEYLNVKIEYVL